MSDLILSGGSVLDVVTGEYSEADILCRDGEIVEIGDVTAGPDADIVDCKGKFILPGLIDCHVHVKAESANLNDWSVNSSFLTAYATSEMKRMLTSGFTAVRDAAGGDFGLSKAQELGYVQGPRLYYCGHALSQINGHGDGRFLPDERDQPLTDGSLARLATGVAEVRKAAREELRKGANHIKIMASGGIASPSDRIESTQFSEEEISAVVSEADAADRYVSAHAYGTKAVSRALKLGVRSIEHGDFVDKQTLELFLEKGAYLDPTLVTYRMLLDEGLQYGLPEASYKKVGSTFDAGMETLRLADSMGVNLVFGTDLIGASQRHQSLEFEIRAQVQSNLAVIQGATVNAAELIRDNKIGTINVGNWADLIIVDSDPLEDIHALSEFAERNTTVVQGGKIVVNNQSK